MCGLLQCIFLQEFTLRKNLLDNQALQGMSEESKFQQSVIRKEGFLVKEIKKGNELLQITFGSYLVFLVVPMFC